MRALIIPFEKNASAPLDNSICERVIKRAIMHRKNSLFYKTETGARTGDAFMSLIYTADLNGAQPFDYLVALQRNHVLVEENPEEWMPLSPVRICKCRRAHAREWEI